MRNIYIEAGVANLWTTCIPFLNQQEGEWEVELFEPNPHGISTIERQIRRIKSEKWRFNFHPVAISVSNEDKLFYSGGRGRQRGSSFFKKFDCDPIKVACIDFSDWMIKNLNPQDNIVLLMDVEGAEYEVLSKMIDDGSIFYVKKLRVEFHKFGWDNQLMKKIEQFMKTFDIDKQLWKIERFKSSPN